MTAKNPYRKSSHLGIKICKKIIHLFSEDFTATQASKILTIERKTINDWYNYLREAIVYKQTLEQNEIFAGTIEMDESYFGPKRIRGKRGRGAGGKIKVFGLLKREGKVYTQIIDDASAKTLIPIIRGKVDQESIMNTDRRPSYDGLVDIGFEKHYRVHHAKNEFARGKQHINGIESFRSYCKRRLHKFNGIKNDRFLYHLKECEFRFNCGRMNLDIYNEMIILVKKYRKLL